jgi:1-acyl-sn-glycerol-3-phosphate acyltransferase
MDSTGRFNYYKATLVFKVLRLLLHGLFFLLFRIKVTGLENLPRGGGYILAGNHLSWIDPFLMLVYFPAEPRIYIIGEKKNMENPPYRRFFTRKVGGVIMVDNEKNGLNRELLNKVKEMLEGGGVLALFPEGDVSAIETGRILPLKRGMAFFAAKAGAPIVPVGFSGTKEMWVGKRIRVFVGKPIPSQKGGKEVEQHLTDETASALRALLPPPPPDPGGIKLLHKFFTNLFTREQVEHPVPD